MAVLFYCWVMGMRTGRVVLSSEGFLTAAARIAVEKRRHQDRHAAACVDEEPGQLGWALIN